MKKGAIIAFVIALIIFFMSIKTLHVNSQGVSDAIATTLVDTKGKLNPQNEGKLVLVSGTPELINGIVEDEEMGISLRKTCTIPTRCVADNVVDCMINASLLRR